MKNRQRGFSLIELIVAVAVIGALSIWMFTMMNSSSGMYQRTSAESALQSEAQLVANSINDVLIESKKVVSDFDVGRSMLGTYTADNASADGVTITPSDSNNEFLVFETINPDGSKTIYRIIWRKDKKEVYLVREEADGTVTTSLLGEYVEDFKVNLDRYETDNLISYELTINKRGQSYKGQYQVYIRNQEAFGSGGATPPPDADPTLTKVVVDPPKFYVDIKNNMVSNRWYKSSPSNVNDSFYVLPSDKKLGLTVQPYGSISPSKVNYTWEIDAPTGGWATIAANTGTTSGIQLVDGADFEGASSTFYTVTVTGKGTYEKDGETKTTSPQSARAVVNLRMCRSVNLEGTSAYFKEGWDPIYKESPYYVTDEPMDCPRYLAAGKSVNLKAKLDLVNVNDLKGVRWKLEVRAANQDDSAFHECTDASLASLLLNNDMTTNTVKLGANAGTEHVFRVTATSLFDESKSGSFKFGVIPVPKTSSDDGAYSRGYKTNLSRLYRGKQPTEKTDGSSSNYNTNEVPNVKDVKFFKVTKVDGSGNSSESDGGTSKVSITQDSNGEFRLYIDYNAFSYSGDQKKNLYEGGLLIHYVMGYVSDNADKTYCLIGEGAGNYVSEFAAAAGCASSAVNVIQKDIKYVPKPVRVDYESPKNPVIVLAKGKSRNVSVKTNFYNIMEPRSGTMFFGAYLGKDTDTTGDMSKNLLVSTNSESNAYFSVNMLTEYGNAEKYVDIGTVTLTAKTSNSKYLTDPITLRLTADDYYRIKIGTYPNSKIDYSVITANVEGADVYFPTKDSTSSVTGTLPGTVGTSASAATTVTGLSAEGTAVTGKVYKTSNKYYLNYGSKTYVYNTTDRYWKATS